MTTTPRTLPYGDHDAHVGDLALPDDGTHPAVAVLVHGGFWRDEWKRDLMDGLAADLCRRGYATWNIEYRRVGPTGGGWPQTGDDVVRAARALPTFTDHALDGGRLILLGHSAGAQLALRAADALRAAAEPPVLVVALSGVLDLVAAARSGVGWGSVEAFLGGTPDAFATAYGDASPIAHLPIGVPQLLVHGTADRHVPFGQSETYHRRARDARDPAELVAHDGVDHFAVIDPASAAWATAAAAIERLAPP